MLCVEQHAVLLLPPQQHGMQPACIDVPWRGKAYAMPGLLVQPEG
jgi:hypothetical protein